MPEQNTSMPDLSEISDESLKNQILSKFFKIRGAMEAGLTGDLLSLAKHDRRMSREYDARMFGDSDEGDSMSEDDNILIADDIRINDPQRIPARSNLLPIALSTILGASIPGAGIAGYLLSQPEEKPKPNPPVEIQQIQDTDTDTQYYVE